MTSTTPSEGIHYFLGSRLLGSFQQEARNNGSHSIALVCSTCGVLWGRILSGTGTFWDVRSTPCEKHEPNCVSNIGDRSGSFLNWPGVTDRRYLSTMFWCQELAALPREILLWELEQHIRHFERTHS